MDTQPLKGRVIAIPETREVEIFASMLERRGATVVRCPMVAILDAPDPAPVLEWSRRFASGSCDDLILLTGEGLRRILSCIERSEPALKDTFIKALGPVRKITRGPKPARVLRELGFATFGVLAALAFVLVLTLQRQWLAWALPSATSVAMDGAVAIAE